MPTDVFESLKVKHNVDGGTEFYRTNKYPWYLRWMLKWLQGRCQHRTMKADLLEGAHEYYSIRWCETCGAVQLVCDGCPSPLRNCRPDFES